MAQRGHCSVKRNCRKRLRLKNSRPVPVCFRRFSGAKARTPKNLRKHSAHGRRAAAHPQYRPISRTDPRLGDVACAESLILLFRYYRINTIGRRGTAQYAASRSSPLTSSGKRSLLTAARIQIRKHQKLLKCGERLEHAVKTGLCTVNG